jgi:hypothetical protein
MDNQARIVDSLSVPTILFIDHQNHGISRVHIGSDAVQRIVVPENGAGTEFV